MKYPPTTLLLLIIILTCGCGTSGDDLDATERPFSAQVIAEERAALFAIDNTVASAANMSERYFDIEGARNEGYSDDEILQHIKTKYDYDASPDIKAGASKVRLPTFKGGITMDQYRELLKKFGISEDETWVHAPDVSDFVMNPVNAVNALERCQYSLNNDVNIVNGVVSLYSTGQPVNGVACFYYINGSVYQEDTYKNGIREGYSRWYYESGKLKEEEPYKNGMREGINREYYENGMVKQEISYRNDKMEGPARWYSDSGLLERDVLHKDDKKEGIGKRYFESGRIESETPFVNDMINGVAKSYFESGRLSGETPFKDNKREGYGPIYTETGQLWGRMRYKNDELVSGVCGDGRVLTNAELINMENGFMAKCGVK